MWGKAKTEQRDRPTKAKRLSIRKSKGPRTFIGNTGEKDPGLPTTISRRLSVKEWEKQQGGALSVLLFK